AHRVELESSSLEPDRVTRDDGGVFARGSLRLPASRMDPRIDVAVRMDRWRDDWIASHEIALRATAGFFTAGIAHRSAFSPPAASDQFFAAGFAIAPNPELQPERVRSEVELTLSTALDVGDVPVELGASAFRGDIDGMIVWAPDFRFVWSPRNRDVKRSGGEAWLRAQPVRGLELGAWVARARVTYDWPGEADTVQVVYRPRHSAGVSAAWTRDEWSASADAFYTGLRYATPGHANPLRGYWDVRIAAGRIFRRGPLELDAKVRVDRLLNNTDSFVHGYAEPGRRVSLEMRVRSADPEHDITLTSRDP
ncbi:MAG TPA: TonB-dependent receptor, partial [Longimicrobiales bacterium]